jgi:hypothetical protein
LTTGKACFICFSQTTKARANLTQGLIIINKRHMLVVLMSYIHSHFKSFPTTLSTASSVPFHQSSHSPSSSYPPPHFPLLPISSAPLQSPQILNHLPFVVSPNPFVTPVTASPSPLPAPATTFPVVLVMPDTPWPTVLPAAPRVLPRPDAAVPKKPGERRS